MLAMWRKWNNSDEKYHCDMMIKSSIILSIQSFNQLLNDANISSRKNFFYERRDYESVDEKSL